MALQGSLYCDKRLARDADCFEICEHTSQLVEAVLYLLHIGLSCELRDIDAVLADTLVNDMSDSEVCVNTYFVRSSIGGQNALN